ncbi:MAG: hypothetical protein U0934_09860 [Pseudotabrizicola sp.]|uniref:hypothetical protein n=1 Tax=Pseudotabrizicola sp. TaxID=2939647 RepID=UPI0027318503|nr:hypothetical protein [Pseudotabrizicola sp.]MDP2079713.1 hypothetical protein [Pseudotabrizicola sp.]MDZ7574248.1 hypothetical protein [Pseudotabrizicola sp.]
MTDHCTEDEVIAAIPGMTRPRLVAFLRAKVVLPTRRRTPDSTPRIFGQIDIARMRLLCDLTDGLDIEEDALVVVMSLIDQLHMARRDLRALALAVQAETPETRARIGAAFRRSPR